MKHLLLLLLLVMPLSLYAQDDSKVEEEDIEVAIGIDEIRTINFKIPSRKNISVGDRSKLIFQYSNKTREIIFRGKNVEQETEKY